MSGRVIIFVGPSWAMDLTRERGTKAYPTTVAHERSGSRLTGRYTENGKLRFVDSFCESFF
jgi:hypothetical protein